MACLSRLFSSFLHLFVVGDWYNIILYFHFLQFICDRDAPLVEEIVIEGSWQPQKYKVDVANKHLSKMHYSYIVGGY